MDAEKFELLEAKIRDTALLVTRLREEKQRVEDENVQLRAYAQELEEALQQAQAVGSRLEPNLDSLLQQLDSLHDGSGLSQTLDPVVTGISELEEQAEKGSVEYFQLGQLHEQQAEFEAAIDAYQHTLRLDPENLEAVQRLAFLLEKLNRDTEAAPLWDRVWAMQEAQTTSRRRRR